MAYFVEGAASQVSNPSERQFPNGVESAVAVAVAVAVEGIQVVAPWFQQNSMGDFGPAIRPPLLYSGAIRPAATAHTGLPTDAATGRYEGVLWYITNGRKSGEAAGAGTGQMCYWSNGVWRKRRDDLGGEV